MKKIMLIGVLCVVYIQLNAQIVPLSEEGVARVFFLQEDVEIISNKENPVMIIFNESERTIFFNKNEIELKLVFDRQLSFYNDLVFVEGIGELTKISIYADQHMLMFIWFTDPKDGRNFFNLIKDT